MFQPLARLTGHSADVLVGRVSPDSTTVATGSADKSVVLWDPSTSSAIRCFSHESAIADISYHGSSYGIYTASIHGHMRLFDLRVPGPISVIDLLSPEGDDVTAMASGNSVNSTVLVCGTKSGDLHSFDLRRSTLSVTSFGHYGAVSTIDMSPDDSLILTCSLDSTVRVFSTLHGDCVQTYSSHEGSPIGAVWGPDREVVTLYNNGLLQVGDKKLRVSRNKFIKTLASTPDGLAVPNDNGTVDFVSSHSPTRTVKAHCDVAMSAHSTDRLMITTGGREDSSGVIWARAEEEREVTFDYITPEIEGLI
jgi:WD40 repeat protein